jgi:DNA-binding HxlR family transcriptional regulator
MSRYCNDVAKKRNYSDGCLASHALDLIGERWALPVVKELLLGPKRYTDLQAGLRGVSTNTLSERLHDLEEIGVLRKHKLKAPAGVWVYELTDWGRQLEPVLMSLGTWAMGSPFKDLRAEASIGSLLLALRGRYQADHVPGSPAAGTAVLLVDEEDFTVRVDGDAVDVVRGGAAEYDALLKTDIRSFQKMIIADETPDEAVVDGRAVLEGDRELIRILIG